eukprot:SM000002S05752  [mRNA]  locus=s2:2065751:2066237:+ [translate_table: standard]
MSPAALAASPALLAQGIGFVAGAVAFKALLDRDSAAASVASNPCPSCHGSRTVPCLCTKWSDNDVGCSSCGGSGRMSCRSCGGSGTRKPLPVRIDARNMKGRSGL